MLNKQGPGKIDWTDWTWNPISGCLHGCEYCYMHRMEKRFPGIMVPKFRLEYLERFKQTKKVKPGDKIFVGSSGDMWGEWVPLEWISQVLSATARRPDVTFQFLTKNPKKYEKWYLWKHPNCWFGTTVDGTARTKNNLSMLIRSTPGNVICFVSFEPLIERPLLELDMFQYLDWIIIGADSTRGAKKPPKEWADYMISTARSFDIPVWVKDNYEYPEIIKEFPKG